MTTRRRGALVVLVLALAAPLGGCGEDDGDESEEFGDNPAQIETAEGTETGG